jgi:ProP effector
MSNASLKEQLEALSLGSGTGTETVAPRPYEKDKKPKHNRSEKKSPAQQKPAWLEYAQYGVELLKAHFPLCFKEIKEIKPLKIGIKQDLVKLLSTREEIVLGDKACMVSSLAYYVNSAGYHKSVVAGAMRIDLNGEPAGAVTPEESQYSTDCRKAKQDKKKTPVVHAKAVEHAEPQ